MSRPTLTWRARSATLLVTLVTMGVAPVHAAAQETDAASAHPCHGPECLHLEPFDPMAPAYLPPRPQLEMGIDWELVSAAASTVFFRFFSNLAPSPSGIQRGNLHENPYTEMAVPLGEGPLSLVVLGMGNNFWLRPDRFYREYNGAAGLRVGLLPRGPFQISVSALPAALTLANVNEYAGTFDDEALPSALTLGAGGGIGALWRMGPLTAEASTHAIPSVDVSTGATGVRRADLVQLTVSLDRLLGLDGAYPFDLAVQGLHTERGDALEAVYQYEPERHRSPRALGEVWQAMVWLALRRE